MNAPEDRLNVQEASEILGRTVKSVNALIQRKRKPDGIGLRSKKDRDGHVWTTRAWIEEYLEEGRVPQEQRDEYKREGRIRPRSGPVAPQLEKRDAPTSGEPTSVPEIIEELERLLARLRAVLVGR